MWEDGEVRFLHSFLVLGDLFPVAYPEVDFSWSSHHLANAHLGLQWVWWRRLELEGKRAKLTSSSPAQLTLHLSEYSPSGCTHSGQLSWLHSARERGDVCSLHGASNLSWYILVSFVHLLVTSHFRSSKKGLFSATFPHLFVHIVLLTLSSSLSRHSQFYRNKLFTLISTPK